VGKAPFRAVCLALLLAATPAAAQRAVSEVLDATTVRLDDGETVRLAGIVVPAPPFWPRAGAIADAAAARMRALAAGRRLALTPDPPPRDRHGRLLAQATRDDGLWLQGALLGEGLALVRTLPEAAGRAAEMLAVEAEARRAGRGLWALGAEIRVFGADDVPADGFRIVEGRVLDAAKLRGRTYLNFGPDWRTDFSATIAPEDQGPFRAAGFDPLALKGATVRLRGWVRDWNGPMLRLDHPEQIEVVGGTPPNPPGDGAARRPPPAPR